MRHARTYYVNLEMAEPAVLIQTSTGLQLIQGTGMYTPIPQLAYVNGMWTNQASAIDHAVTLSKLAGMPVLAIYNAANRVPDSLFAKLRISDDCTRLLAALFTDCITFGRQLILSAQSLGTIKAQNAARSVYRTRCLSYRRTMTKHQASVAAARDLRTITYIFTGNAVKCFEPYLYGYTIYNHGDPVTNILGNRQGGPHMPPITIRHTPLKDTFAPHRYHNQVAAVAAVVRTVRS